MLADGPLSQREERELIRRERAKHDFYNLGAKRSVEKLFRYYVKLARENQDNPEVLENIPSRNKSQLQRWAREDNWDYWARQRDAKVQEQIEADQARQRMLVIQSMTMLTEKAVQTLNALMEPSQEPRIRLEAAKELLDRTGYGRIDRKVIEQTINDTRGMDVPDPDTASDDDIIQFLARKRDLETQRKAM
jgi:hypothetical protein